MIISKLAELLLESKYTVVLGGYGMLLENGYPALRDGEESYENEIKYGYSFEELLSSAFLSTRPELFYEFYRNEILSTLDVPPGKGFRYLAELENRNLIQNVITRRIFGLPDRAGCKNVINLHGSIMESYCPHCGTRYDAEYTRNGSKVPHCIKCQTTIRPDVVLFGEMVDNAVITQAAKEVEKADVLLVLGTKLTANLCNQLINYYNGNKLVQITLYEHYADRLADYVIHSRVDETLELLMQELGDRRKN